MDAFVHLEKEFKNFVALEIRLLHSHTSTNNLYFLIIVECAQMGHIYQ
jgi:hypothetical protein